MYYSAYWYRGYGSEEGGEGGGDGGGGGGGEGSTQSQASSTGFQHGVIFLGYVTLSSLSLMLDLQRYP